MFELKNIPLPRSIQAFTLGSRVATFEGLAQMGKADLIRPSSTEDDIRNSFSDFVGSFAQLQDFKEMLNRSIKEGSILDPNKFTLLAHNNYATSTDPPFNAFFCDGLTTVFLFYGDLKDRVGVAASMDLHENKKWYGSYSRTMDTRKMSDKDPVIIQIQGPSDKSVKGVEKTFSGFRWEKLLVEIYIKWARQAGYSKMFLLPSEFNEWEHVARNINGTAYKRFDVTAQRLGFRREKDDEPYLLTSDDNTREMFKEIVSASKALSA